MKLIDADKLLSAIEKRKNNIHEEFDYYDVAEFELRWIEKFVLSNGIEQSEQLKLLVKKAVKKERKQTRKWLRNEGYELLSEKL
jgi:hypothetical protein